MLGLTEPGTPVMLSRTKNPLRKTRHTLEMLKPREVWIAVNTHLTNDLAESLIRANMLSPALSDIDSIRREVTVGASRLDFLLTQKGKPVYVEVKSVTLQVGDDPHGPEKPGQEDLHALPGAARGLHLFCPGVAHRPPVRRDAREGTPRRSKALRIPSEREP
jgi:sugar fermentation stimulation protein A